jgi:hypothetical protein
LALSLNVWLADALEPDRRRMTREWDLLPGEGV